MGSKQSIECVDRKLVRKRVFFHFKTIQQVFAGCPNEKQQVLLNALMDKKEIRVPYSLNGFQAFLQTLEGEEGEEVETSPDVASYARFYGCGELLYPREQ